MIFLQSSGYSQGNNPNIQLQLQVCVRFDLQLPLPDDLFTKTYAKIVITIQVHCWHFQPGLLPSIGLPDTVVIRSSVELFQDHHSLLLTGQRGSPTGIALG